MRKNGFTIVEIITSTFIMGIIAIAISALFVWGWRTWQYSNDQARAINAFRKAYDQTVKEIREMQTASNGAYNIESATAAELIFYANTDSDDERERVRLTLTGNNLIKGIIQPVGSPAAYPQGSETTSVIAQYIRNSNIFSYYDQNFTGAENPLTIPVNVSSIRLVRFFLSIDVDPNRPPAAFDLSTNTALRNLKQNL
ncbi:MAG: hypothetical protein AAB793_00775 [Patescibacteria group bacterium]